MKLLMVLSPRRYESGRAERSMLSLKNNIRKGVFLQRPACIAEPSLMIFIEVGRESVVDTLVIGVEPADFLGQHLFDNDRR